MLNITNGLCFDNYFKKSFNKESISFNEALMIGDLRNDLFSKEFIKQRVIDLDTTIEEYNSLLSKFIIEINNLDKYKTINLYFGDDVFCVINLIAILSILEEKSFKGNVLYNVINEVTNEIIEVKQIELGSYINLYNNVINRNNVNSIFNKQIELYYDYLSDNSVIKTFIKNNINLNNDELIKKVINKFPEYGITDIQINKIIKELK